MLRPRLPTLALSVAMVFLLTATACSLDDPTPATDNKAAQQAEVTTTAPTASVPAPDAGTAAEPSEAGQTAACDHVQFSKVPICFECPERS